jgi:hypothetical protein
MTFLVGLGWPCMGEIKHPIGTHSCHIGDGKFTRTWNSLMSQFLTMISPITSTLPSPKNMNSSHRSLSLHIMIQSLLRVQHTLRNASSHDRLSPARSQSHFFADHVVLNSVHSDNYKLPNK